MAPQEFGGGANPIEEFGRRLQFTDIRLPTLTFPTPPELCSCRTISTPIVPPRSTRPFPPPRRAGSSSASNGIPRPSTEACLDRRIPDKQTIVDQVNAWTKSRNAANAGADWRFTTADARIKLRSLYPST
jgi:hypothetical protein